MYLVSRHVSGNGKVSLLTKCWRKVNEPKYSQSGEAGERSKTQPSTKQSSSGRVTRMGLLRWRRRVCAFWVHITWRARAGCKTAIPYLQHISISYKTYNYNKSYKKSKIGHHFPIFYLFFYPFFTPGFLTFSPIFGKKNLNFFLVPKWPYIAFKSLEQVYLVFIYLQNQFYRKNAWFTLKKNLQKFWIFFVEKSEILGGFYLQKKNGFFCIKQKKNFLPKIAKKMWKNFCRPPNVFWRLIRHCRPLGNKIYIFPQHNHDIWVKKWKKS